MAVAQGQTQKKKEEEESDNGMWGRGLGVLINNPIVGTALKPLEVLDYGKRAMILGAEEFAEALGGREFSAQVDPETGELLDTRSNWDKLKDPTYGVGQLLGDFIDTPNDTFDKWANRGLGLIGDIALDPLTYATFGVGGAAKAGTTGIGRAARTGKIADAVMEARKAGTLTDEMVNTLQRVGQKGYGSVGSDVLENLDMGRQGLRFRAPIGGATTGVVPGTEKIGEAVNRATGAVRGRLNSSDRIQRLMQGRTPKELERATTALTSGKGSTADFLAAADTVAMNRMFRRYSQTFAELSAREIDAAMTEAKKELADYGNLDEYLRATELKTGPETALNRLSKKIVANAEELYGVKIPELQGLDYIPHILSPEFRQILRDGGDEAKQFMRQVGLVTEDIQKDSGFLAARQLRPFADTGKPKIIKLGGRSVAITEGSIPEINAKIKELFPQLKTTALETDPQTLFERYAVGISGDVGLRKARAEMAALPGANVVGIDPGLLDETVSQVRRTADGKRAPDPFAANPYVQGSLDEGATEKLNARVAQQAQQTIDENLPFADQARVEVAQGAGSLRDEIAAPMIQRNRQIGRQMGQLDGEVEALQGEIKEVGLRKRRARSLAQRTIANLKAEADQITKDIRAIKRSTKGRTQEEVRQYVSTLNTRMNRLLDEAESINRILSGEGGDATREALAGLKQQRDELYASVGLAAKEAEKSLSPPPTGRINPEAAETVGMDLAAPDTRMTAEPEAARGLTSPPPETFAPVQSAVVEPSPVTSELSNVRSSIQEQQRIVREAKVAQETLDRNLQAQQSVVESAGGGNHKYHAGGKGKNEVYDIKKVGRGLYEVETPTGKKLEGQFQGLQNATNAAEQDWLKSATAVAKSNQDTLPTPTARRAQNAAERTGVLRERARETKKAAAKAEKELEKLRAREADLVAQSPTPKRPTEVAPTPRPPDPGRALERVPVAANRTEFEAFLAKNNMTEADWNKMFPPPPKSASRERTLGTINDVVDEAEANGRTLRETPNGDSRLSYFATDKEFDEIKRLEGEIEGRQEALAAARQKVNDDEEVASLRRKLSNKRKGSPERDQAERNLQAGIRDAEKKYKTEEISNLIDQTRNKITRIYTNAFDSELSQKYRRYAAGLNEEKFLADVNPEPWTRATMKEFIDKRAGRLVDSETVSASRRAPQVQKSLGDTRKELGASLQAGREGAPPSGAQEIMDRSAADLAATVDPMAQRRGQLRQGAKEVPEDLQREIDSLTQQGQGYKAGVESLQNDKAALQAEREQIKEALAAAPSRNKASNRLMRSEKEVGDVVETGLRPTAKDLKATDVRAPGLHREQPLASSLDDIEAMVALNPNLDDTVLNGVEARLDVYRKQLENATVQDIKASQAQQVLDAATKKDFVEVIKAKLREEWTLTPEGDILMSREFMKMNEYLNEIAKTPGAVGRLMTSYTNFFKTYATLSPGFHIRNAISATFMNAVDGVPVKTQTEAIALWKSYMDAAKEGKAGDFMVNLRKTKPRYAEAFEAVFGTGAGGRFTEAGFAESTAINRTKAKEAVYRNWATRKSQSWGSNVEGSVRLGMALDSVVYNKTSVEQAIDRISRIHFDYSQVSKFDEQAKKLIPFWTFMSRNLPMQITEMWTKPKGYAIYNSFVRNFATEPDADTPEYMLEQGAWNTGFKTPDWIPGMGEGMDVMMLPDLPHTRVTADVENLGNVAGLSDLGGLASSFNPALTVPIEYATGTNLFTGQQFGPDDYRKASGPLDMAMLPLMKLLGQTDQRGDGIYYQEKGVDALRSLNPIQDRLTRIVPGSTGSSGDPDRQLESLLRFLGFPIRTLSEQQKQNTRQSRYYDKLDEAQLERVLSGGG